MEQLLSHPLVVLAVGAALTGLLIPRITQRWQDQRKALEIKTDLIERVSSAVSDIFTATQFASVGAESQSEEKFDEAYRSWCQQRVALTSLIKAYFDSEDLNGAWLRCRACATAYYVQFGIQREDEEATARARSFYLRTVAAGLVSAPPEDWSEEAYSSSADSTKAPVEIEELSRLRSETWRNLDITVSAIRKSEIRF